MNHIQSTAYALVAWLKVNQPFNGTCSDMAQALGVTTNDINFALGWIRDPDTVAVTGYDIPKQPRGLSYSKAWEVVDIADGPILIPEKASNAASLERVFAETVRVIDKEIAHLSVLYGKCDHRSQYGKAVNAAMGILTGASMSVDNLPVPA